MKQIAEGLLQKADRAVTAADKLVPIDAESAISRAYYAMFYAAEALPWLAVALREGGSLNAILNSKNTLLSMRHSANISPRRA